MQQQRNNNSNCNIHGKKLKVEVQEALKKRLGMGEVGEEVERRLTPAPI